MISPLPILQVEKSDVEEIITEITHILTASTSSGSDSYKNATKLKDVF